MELTESLKRLGRPVVFYPGLARVIGIEEAIFLAQLIYWTPRSRTEDGWVFKSADDWQSETSLTYRQQMRVREELRKRGLIEDRYKRLEHRLYFRALPEAVDCLCGASDETSDGEMTKRQVASDKTSGGTLRNVRSNTKGSIDYSEITHRRLSDRNAEHQLRADAWVEIRKRRAARAGVR